MVIDPTAWRSDIDAWRYWKSRAEQCEKTVYEIRAGYEEVHGVSLRTDTRIADDKEYQREVGRQQFAVQQAGMYADGVQIRMLESIVAELKHR